MKIKLFLIILPILFAAVWWISITPSNDRQWSTDQAVLPYADIEGDLVHIYNIRNFEYTTPADYEVNYYDKTFNLNKIKAVYYVVEPFSGFQGAAHTFLSFEFEGDNFVSISVEIRKEKGEEFSAIKGVLKQYEIMYVIGDERDLIKLRSNYRNDLVYVYPIKTTKEKIRSLFLDMITRTNKLKTEPEFYNTLTNACTINIIKHVNKISPNKIPFSIEAILPENSDRVAYKLGLLDTDLPFEEARKRFLINDRAKKYADSPDFSVKIREFEEK
jgi:hypothetical protein